MPDEIQPSGYHRVVYLSRPRPLNQCEKALLLFLGKGYIQQEIADYLGISLQTVKNRLETIREKLGTHTTINAVYLHFVDGKG